MTIFTLLFLLLTKHFVVDFLLQPPFMWMNKGNLRHPGGYVHAGLHALVTGVLFLFFFKADLTFEQFFAESHGGPIWPIFALLIGSFMLFEFVCHYAIDFAKVNLNKKFDWKPESSEKFWYLMGLDQYLHYLTYYGIFYALQKLVQGA